MRAAVMRRRNNLVFNLPRNLEIVLHREDTRYLVGAHAGHLLVTLAVHHARQHGVAVHHHDADRLLRIDGVLGELRIAVDGVIQVPADAPVVRRHRCDLNLVDNVANTGRVLDHAKGIVFVDWFDCESTDGDHAVMYLQDEAVERIRLVSLPHIDQGLGEFLKQLLVRDIAAACDVDVVADGSGLVHLVDALFSISLVGIAIHLTGQVNDASLHLDLNAAEPLAAELFLSVSLYLCITPLLGCGSGHACSQAESASECNQNTTITSHGASSNPDGTPFIKLDASRTTRAASIVLPQR